MTRKVKRKADSALNFITRHKKKLIVIAVVVALIAVYVRSTRIGGNGPSEKNDDVTENVNVVERANVIKKVDVVDNDFLKLVDEHYDEKDLVEWEPAPPPVSRPDEPGNLGAAVVVPPELQEASKERFGENEFDVVANEMMSVNRTLTDSRYPECLSIQYPSKLPTVSVIIVFHNEAWSTLTRTLWSVITQTPKALLKEIILVDDFSSSDFLGQKLHDYVKELPVSVVVVRHLKRKGLIKARLLGVKYAKAKVLVFLDAHCECNQGWLEPLLTPIVKSRSTVVVPIIDVINFNNMQYVTAVTDSRGVFDMTMTFAWAPIPSHELSKDRTALTKAPAMAGGLFAIDKEYFLASGSYDEEMVIWGGENIEMSLRIWMCGGRILSAPCSRVGHIFRDNSPYEMPGGTEKVIFGNEARFVDVWLDEYKTVFYTVVPTAADLRTDVSKRIELRKKLKCKSFKWYLDNVFPEAPLNIDFHSISQIQSVFLEKQCLDTMGRRANGDKIGMSQCHNQGGNQAFMFTKANEIRARKFCLDATAVGAEATIYVCHNQGGNQHWQYDAETQALKHITRNCLTALENATVILRECDGSLAQQWILNNLEPKLQLE